MRAARELLAVGDEDERAHWRVDYFVGLGEKAFMARDPIWLCGLRSTL
jgi:hypothetical protein